MPTAIAIAPALGHGLLATQGGVGAAPGYDAIDLRRMIQGLHGNRQGVLDPAGWKVSERAAGPAMAVDVAASTGLARVNGVSVAEQGGYVIAPHATMITLDVPASDATNPRVDVVYLVVRDNAHDGSGATDARVVVVAGTPTAGATLSNQAGAPSAPTSSAMRLADVLVAANASSVTNGQIRTRRPLIVPGREVGDTFFWPVSSSPPGCSVLNGAAHYRLVFSELFALLSTTFGAGDGSTTFNVPQADGRGLVGSGVSFAFGAKGGAQTHSLTEAQGAKHSHTPVSGGTDPRFTVSDGVSTVGVPNGTFHNLIPANYAQQRTAPSGQGAAHNNMPPYLALRPVIFTGVA
jgi:microcystin-dependent protein